MANDHSDSEGRNPLPSDELFFPISKKVSFLYTIQQEGNVYLTTHFILRLYSVRHMVKDHSDCERRNPLPPHGLHFPINNKGHFICTIL